MGFDSEGKFAPPTILLGLLLCPWVWGISSQLLQCLPSYWGFSDLGRRLSPQGRCSYNIILKYSRCLNLCLYHNLRHCSRNNLSLVPLSLLSRWRELRWTLWPAEHSRQIIYIRKINFRCLFFLIYIANRIFYFKLHMWFTFVAFAVFILNSIGLSSRIQPCMNYINSGLTHQRDFPGGSDGKAYNAGDPGSVPGLGRSPRKWQPTPVYSCLENPMEEEPGRL